MKRTTRAWDGSRTACSSMIWVSLKNKNSREAVWVRNVPFLRGASNTFVIRVDIVRLSRLDALNFYKGLGR